MSKFLKKMTIISFLITLLLGLMVCILRDWNITKEEYLLGFLTGIGIFSYFMLHAVIADFMIEIQAQIDRDG